MKKNPVVHFEIYADDPDKLGKFYTRLFDWTLVPVPGMDYTVVRTVETDEKGMPLQAGGINGGLMKRPAGSGSLAGVNYVLVESVDTSVARARELGASVMRGKSPVPGMGWYAILVDPQGNPFAVWQMDKDAK